ncbi:MAG: FixH family protein [Anaerolineae bacterium]
MMLLSVVAGCGRMQTGGAPPQDGFAMTMAAQPSPPAVGDGQLIVTLADPAGKPVADARLEVEGNMSHAGMKPSFGTVTAAADGRYTIAIQWTMAGDWYVDIRATLADGRVIARRFPITVHAR